MFQFLTKRRKKFLLLFITLLLILIVLEFSTRIYYFGLGNAFSYYGFNGVGGIGETGFIRKSDFCDIVYEFKPDIRGYSKFTRFETNSQGLRDKEYTIEKPAGVFRIVVLGDSMTVPDGVGIEEAYHSIIENDEELNRILGKKVEVINFAVSGYGPENYLAVLKHKALSYEPDMILIGFFEGNDFMMDKNYCNLSIKNRDHLFLRKEKNHFYKSYFKTWATRKLGLDKDKEEGEYPNLPPEAIRAQRVIEKYVKDPDKDYDLINEIIQKAIKYDKVFDEIKEISISNNIPVMFVLIPDLNNELHDEESYLLPLHGACNKGFIVVDSLTYLRGYEGGYFKLYRYDKHYNSKANRLIADSILDALIKGGTVVDCSKIRSTAGFLVLYIKRAITSKHITDLPKKPRITNYSAGNVTINYGYDTYTIKNNQDF